MKGSHFELIDAACTVKPIQKPTPPVWVGANADRAIERAARLTDAWFINPHNTVATTARQMEVYKRALDKAGKPMPEELPMMREVVVGRSREEAIRTAEPYLMAKYRAYKEWGQDKVMPEGDGDFGQDYEDLLKDPLPVRLARRGGGAGSSAIFAGSPSTISCSASSIRGCRKAWCSTRWRCSPKR